MCVLSTVGIVLADAHTSSTGHSEQRSDHRDDRGRDDFHDLNDLFVG